ncbi:unnamed protein product [Candidula unifasciata]|uniref:ASD2 domain-containing protein n=1 Tax=Candidula unifasciata TaxID=100452 RepID=A0A8S3Z528_9EUPU|nr:unnamed protein product [Candidula unifasciata]
MDSGLVVSPIYQNFPTKRRPPPPPRPAASSNPEPPPLPPRMNRDKKPSPGGTRAALDPEPTQYHGSGKEKHRIEVIPLGKPQDQEVRVDTSKMNFKDLMKQWKSNSPGENSSPSDQHQSTDRSMSSAPATFERIKTTTTGATSFYRHDSGYNLDATSPVFSPVSSLSTPDSSASKSACYTSLYSPSGANSETSPSQQHLLGFQPSSLNNANYTVYPGRQTTNSSFTDESYIGHKNKSSRTVGTYKRSVSAVGVQSTGSIQASAPSDVSDSTPFSDFSLGQQSWNSESVLSNTGSRVKTLPEMGSQIGKPHKDGVHGSQGHISGVSSSVTPVRPPRPNARGRQNAKQSSATSAASSSSSNMSQKTTLTSEHLSAPDNVAASVFFNVEQDGVGQKEGLQRSAVPTSLPPQYDLNYQDHWSVQHESNSLVTSTPSGQVLDRSPVNSCHHSHYSLQHRQMALNNSLNSSLSRATLDDNGHPQSIFIQDSTVKPSSPCSPSEQFSVNSPAKDHQRKVHGTTGLVTSPCLENIPRSPLENPASSSHYQPHNTIGSPQESTHRCSSTPSLSHLRQPSQEEVECEEKAMELAEELDNNDQKLLEVLMQDRQKKRMLYMDGLFSDLTVDREKSGFKQKSRSSMKNRTLDRVVGESCEASGGFKSHSLPRDYQQTTASTAALTTELLDGVSSRSSDGSSPGAHENLTVLKHKEELVEKLQKKIQVLKEEKLSLQQEVADNILLGQQVSQVADSRCQTQNEKEKFMTFIEDLEKIVRLLLNLSGQLARAENAVQALGPDTDAKLKKLTWDKRDRLHAKLEEAKMLKEAFDRRSEQLLSMLQERLSTQELSDYKHFISMKSRLTIQMQDVEDHLALAEQQILALKRSLPSLAVSLPGTNREA